MKWYVLLDYEMISITRLWNDINFSETVCIIVSLNEGSTFIYKCIVKPIIISKQTNAFTVIFLMMINYWSVYLRFHSVSVSLKM